MNQNIPALFDAKAREILEARGEKANARTIANRIGESPSAYRRYIRGRCGITAAKLTEWLRRWSDAGLPALSIRMLAEEADVSEVVLQILVDAADAAGPDNDVDDYGDENETNDNDDNGWLSSPAGE